MEAAWPRPQLRLGAALRRREVGSRELLEHQLARIERLNPGLNAVVRSTSSARVAADRRIVPPQGRPAGPLLGLPMTVKDTFETAGLRTTCGVPSSQHVPRGCRRGGGCARRAP
jgi:amidase